MTTRRARIGTLIALALAAGCAREPALPDLDAIYAHVARAAAPQMRRPLITIPGTLGSRLVDRESGRVVWGGGSRGLSADPDDPLEARLIALPVLAPEEPLTALRDGVEAVGIVDRVSPEVLGVPIEVEVYGGVLRTLSAGGFRAEPATEAPRRRPRANYPPEFEDYARLAEKQADAFRFAYDWRRDIPTLARELDLFVRLRKRQVAAIRALDGRGAVRPEDVTFDLLAHSMGGLVARYYLMHGAAELPEDGSLPPITWEGARHFSRVVFVAPPNAGSVIALDNLVNGKTFGAFQPVYPPALLATHASVWQLLPRARHGRLREAGTGRALDPLDPALWERFGWGLLDPEAAPLLGVLMPEVADPAERHRRAAAHQARLIRRAAQVQAALDRWSPPPPGLETFLVVGGGFATPAGAEVDPATGALALTEREEGDGVVLRASALLDERQGRTTAAGLVTPLRHDATLLLPDEHVELTRNPVFGDNLLFWLLESPRRAETLAEPSRSALGLAAAREPAAGGPPPRAAGNER